MSQEKLSIAPGTIRHWGNDPIKIIRHELGPRGGRRLIVIWAKNYSHRKPGEYDFSGPEAPFTSFPMNGPDFIPVNPSQAYHEKQVVILAIEKLKAFAANMKPNKTYSDKAIYNDAVLINHHADM